MCQKSITFKYCFGWWKEANFIIWCQLGLVLKERRNMFVRLYHSQNFKLYIYQIWTQKRRIWWTGHWVVKIEFVIQNLEPFKPRMKSRMRVCLRLVRTVSLLPPVPQMCLISTVGEAASVLNSNDLSSLNSSGLEEFRGQSVTHENRESLSGSKLTAEVNNSGIISPTVKSMSSMSISKGLTESEPFDENEVIFKLKKWNHVSLWKWDVDCDICAICRVVICDPCLTVSTLHIIILN